MPAKLQQLPATCAPIAERLEKVLQLIVERYQPEKIILFGSYAYGTPRRDSDVDLLIVKDTDADPHDRAIEVQRAFDEAQDGLSFTILVRTPRELQQRLDWHDPFIAKIVQKGLVLYAAS